MLLGGVLGGLTLAQISPGQPARADALSEAVADLRRMATVRVIDGDTFDYRGERIRIAEIDAPETHPPRCAYEAELGARATERLRQYLARPFELRTIDRDEDVYGRKLRIVMQDGGSIGERLIAEGLARPYGNGRRPWCDGAV